VDLRIRGSGSLRWMGISEELNSRLMDFVMAVRPFYSGCYGLNLHERASLTELSNVQPYWTIKPSLSIMTNSPLLYFLACLASVCVIE